MKIPAAIVITFTLVNLALLPAARTPDSGRDRTEPKAPRVFCYSPEALERAKEGIAAGDTTLKPAFDRLLSEADRALTVKPVSVLDKASLPPSKDKHDYMSVAPYFWPDPAKKDGLPYIRKDGERNPDASGKDTDAPHFGRMASSVETLSLAYFFTGKQVYADHAARLLRVWFLDPATRMKPNLNYGQAIPGRVDARGTGIIESARLLHVVDSIGLLGSSRSWTAQDQAGMVAWMKDYLNWLLTSKNGRDEQRATNNHGMYYDAQVAALALFTRQDDLAHSILETAKEKRIAAQVQPDGSQPRELERTKSFSYSVFNVTAMEDLAELGERAGVDLWAYRTTDGRGIRKAIAYLAPYADVNKPWPYKQFTRLDRASLLPILQEAYPHYHDDSYWVSLGRLRDDKTSLSRTWLLYPDLPQEKQRVKHTSLEAITGALTAAVPSTANFVTAKRSYQERS